MGLNRSTKPLYENACHEGTHSFPGILAAARRQDLDGQTVQDNVEVEREQRTKFRHRAGDESNLVPIPQF
jgi:hypothetical protein